jgi:hypothetical protein
MMMDVMVHTLETSLDFVSKCVTDIPDDRMVEQPPGVPNHGTWTLGHLAVSCEGMAKEIGAKAWLPEDWEKTFGYQSTPHGDRVRYPEKSEMLAVLKDSGERLGQTLRAADDATVKKALPDESLPTMAHCLMQVVVAHTAFHVGQLAAWRRAIGFESAGVYV